MGKRKHDRKIKVNSKYFKKILKLVTTLSTLTNSERIAYLSRSKKEEIRIISEIVHNFLKCNIKCDTQSLRRMRRVKKYLYQLASKKISFSSKRQILQSLKGLNILNILLPLVLNTLST